MAAKDVARSMRAAILRGDICRAQSLFALKDSTGDREALIQLAVTAQLTGDKVLLNLIENKLGSVPNARDAKVHTRGEAYSKARSKKVKLALHYVNMARQGNARLALEHLRSPKTSREMRSIPSHALSATNAVLRSAIQGDEDLGVACKALRTLRAWGLGPDAYTVNEILAGGAPMQAFMRTDPFHLLRRLWLSGNPPDALTLSLITSEMRKSHAPADLILRWLREFSKFGLTEPSPSLTSPTGLSRAYENVLRACADQGESRLARHIFEEMATTSSSSLSMLRHWVFVSGYRSIARHPMRHHPRKQSQTQSQSHGAPVQDLMDDIAFWDDQLAKVGTKASPQILAARFAALGAANSVESIPDDLLGLIREASQGGGDGDGDGDGKSGPNVLGHSTIVANTALSVLARFPRMSMVVFDLFDSLMASHDAAVGCGFKPDRYTFNALLNAAAEGRRPPRLVLETLDKMKQWNVRPNHVTLNIVLKFSCDSSSLGAILRRFQDMVPPGSPLHAQADDVVKSRAPFVT